jgi:hypothetical protein
MKPPRRPTPEEVYLEKKRAELEVLETQLAERELELHTIRGGMITFEKQFDALTSERYAQLDELHAKIAEKMPAKPVADGQSGQAEAKSQAANGGASRSRRPFRKAPAKPAEQKPAQPAEKPADFNPAETLKRLYRDVAKTMHPDLADSDNDRAQRHQFMIRANEAYEASDEKSLLAVFLEWEQSPASVKGDGAAADLVRVIRKIAWCEERIVRIGMEVHQIQTSGLFGMKMLADEAAQFERDILAEMTQRLDNEIAAAKEQLAQLEVANAEEKPQMNADERGSSGTLSS